ncbi:hypothetical protein D9M68_711380 [compost metagenome]
MTNHAHLLVTPKEPRSVGLMMKGLGRRYELIEGCPLLIHAQRVLDAYHSGSATILGKSSQGFPVVRFEGVTGVNVNKGAGYSAQLTNVFLIKGTKSPSIVPVSPVNKLVN